MHPQVNKATHIRLIAVAGQNPAMNAELNAGLKAAADPATEAGRSDARNELGLYERRKIQRIFITVFVTLSEQGQMFCDALPIHRVHAKHANVHEWDIPYCDQTRIAGGFYAARASPDHARPSPE